MAEQFVGVKVGQMSRAVAKHDFACRVDINQFQVCIKQKDGCI